MLQRININVYCKQFESKLSRWRSHFIDSRNSWEYSSIILCQVSHSTRQSYGSSRFYYVLNTNKINVTPTVPYYIRNNTIINITTTLIKVKVNYMGSDYWSVRFSDAVVWAIYQ